MIRKNLNEYTIEELRAALEAAQQGTQQDCTMESTNRRYSTEEEPTTEEPTTEAQGGGDVPPKQGRGWKYYTKCGGIGLGIGVAIGGVGAGIYYLMNRGVEGLIEDTADASAEAVADVIESAIK